MTLHTDVAKVTRDETGSPQQHQNKCAALRQQATPPCFRMFHRYSIFHALIVCLLAVRALAFRAIQRMVLQETPSCE